MTTTTESGIQTSRRYTWAVWGAGAGLLGVVANLVFAVEQAEPPISAEVVESLSRGPYHAGAVAGYLAAASLLLFAAGLWQWGDAQASRSLAVRAAPLSFVAAAGSLFVGYGVKGQLAEYLPGGMNPDNFPAEGLYVLFMVDDLAGYFSWSAAAVGVACLAWLALRERLLPRWIGIVSALVAVPPLLFLVLTGFTGFSGILVPIGLVVVSAGIALVRE